MKKIINLILATPLLGLIAIYLYVTLNMLSLKTNIIYSVDPKLAPYNGLYNIVFGISLLGYLGIILGGIIVVYSYFHSEKNIYSRVMLIQYLCGTVLTVVFYFFDFGYYQNWFFD